MFSSIMLPRAWNNEGLYDITQLLTFWWNYTLCVCRLDFIITTYDMLLDGNNLVVRNYLRYVNHKNTLCSIKHDLLHYSLIRFVRILCS